MSTQISWIIEGMQCKPEEANLTNVVITAFWRCNGTNEEFNGTIYGSIGFTAPGDPFIPYEQLTQEQVLQWCWNSGINKEEIEVAVEQQIQNQINPPVINLPLPW